jgi:hypothetical protein
MRKVKNLVRLYCEAALILSYAFIASFVALGIFLWPAIMFYEALGNKQVIISIIWCVASIYFLFTSQFLLRMLLPYFWKELLKLFEE